MFKCIISLIIGTVIATPTFSTPIFSLFHKNDTPKSSSSTFDGHPDFSGRWKGECKNGIEKFSAKMSIIQDETYIIIDDYENHVMDYEIGGVTSTSYGAIDKHPADYFKHVAVHWGEDINTLIINTVNINQAHDSTTPMYTGLEKISLHALSHDSLEIKTEMRSFDDLNEYPYGLISMICTFSRSDTPIK